MSLIIPTCTSASSATSTVSRMPMVAARPESHPESQPETEVLRTQSVAPPVPPPVVQSRPALLNQPVRRTIPLDGSTHSGRAHQIASAIVLPAMDALRQYRRY